MTYSTDTNKALATMSTKLGQSIDLLRESHAGLNDADLIEALRNEFSLGHISWPGAPCELRDSDREWLRTSLFSVTENGRLWRGQGQARFPLQYVAGKPHGGISHGAVLRGDELPDEDQRYALENWEVNRGATELETIFYRRGSAVKGLGSLERVGGVSGSVSYAGPNGGARIQCGVCHDHVIAHKYNHTWGEYMDPEDNIVAVKGVCFECLPASSRNDKLPFMRLCPEQYIAYCIPITPAHAEFQKTVLSHDRFIRDGGQVA